MCSRENICGLLKGSLTLRVSIHPSNNIWQKDEIPFGEAFQRINNNND